MAAPRAIVVPASKKHTATIICVHGLGDSGAGWSWLAENWRRRGKFEDTAFVFPSAPQIPISVNAGMRMPGWYDITAFDDDLTRQEDEPGIMRSRAYVHGLINEHIKAGVHPRRIILGGFSQGAALSLFSGLTFPTSRLAGVFALSGYQLVPNKFDQLRHEIAQNNTGTDMRSPVFQAHGQADPLIKVKYARKTVEGLRERGFELEFMERPGLEHSVDPVELDALEEWVTKRLEEGAGFVTEGNGDAKGGSKDEPAL